MKELGPGMEAPDFTALDQEGAAVSLSDFAGQKLLLYFYPKANTPGCTVQAQILHGAKDDLRGLGTFVIGVSPDTVRRQKNFAVKYGLEFPLLSDPEHEIAEHYGVWREKKNYGKTYMGILRSAFLIDEAGMVEQAWYNVKAKDTLPFALSALREE